MKNKYNPDPSPNRLQAPKWEGFKFFCGNFDLNEELNQYLHSSNSLSNSLNSDEIICLSQTQVGDIYTIIKIYPTSCAQDLQDMGFIPEKQIQVISRTPTGSVIVILESENIGLGKDVANTILVRK